MPICVLVLEHSGLSRASQGLTHSCAYSPSAQLPSHLTSCIVSFLLVSPSSCLRSFSTGKGRGTFAEGRICQEVSCSCWDELNILLDHDVTWDPLPLLTSALHVSGFGMSQKVGHMDFFPNGGKDMPGCKTGILNHP